MNYCEYNEWLSFAVNVVFPSFSSALKLVTLTGPDTANRGAGGILVSPLTNGTKEKERVNIHTWT